MIIYLGPNDKIAHSNLVRMMETALHVPHCGKSTVPVPKDRMITYFYLIRTMTDTVTDCLVEGAQVPRSVARVVLQNKTAVLC
jgi:hypothetical protein